MTRVNAQSLRLGKWSVQPFAHDHSACFLVAEAWLGAVPEELLQPGIPEKDHWDGLGIPMLKMELEKVGLSTRGKKAVLVDRLRTATASQQPISAANAAPAGPSVKPGTKGLGKVATAQVCFLQRDLLV